MRSAIGAALILFTACAPTASKPSTDSASPTVSEMPTQDTETKNFVIVGDRRGLTSPCDIGSVATAVSSFIDAYNVGDEEQLEQSFAPAGDGQMGSFVAYSAADKKRSVSFSDRDRLMAYFDDRHSKKDRLRLMALTVQMGRDPNTADFLFVLNRNASDLPRSHGPNVYGKGLLACATDQIALWAMGQQANAPKIASRMCPQPYDGRALAIVCERKS